MKEEDESRFPSVIKTDDKEEDERRPPDPSDFKIVFESRGRESMSPRFKILKARRRKQRRKILMLSVIVLAFNVLSFSTADFLFSFGAAISTLNDVRVDTSQGRIIILWHEAGSRNLLSDLAKLCVKANVEVTYDGSSYEVMEGVPLSLEHSALTGEKAIIIHVTAKVFFFEVEGEKLVEVG